MRITCGAFFAARAAERYFKYELRVEGISAGHDSARTTHRVRERGFEPPDPYGTELPIQIERTLSPALLARLSYSRGGIIPAGAINRLEV